MNMHDYLVTSGQGYAEVDESFSNTSCSNYVITKGVIQFNDKSKSMAGFLCVLVNWSSELP